jgi:SWI/SNF related-matrix-associated actin-dependent regulator of chromatin subfamily C
LKDKKYEICAPCYLDGRFPSTLFSGDFVKLTSQTDLTTQSADEWTDQEILLLLEGVEMYDDDWIKIEEHVGSRSAQQCLRKFLELPIEDPYLGSEGSMGPLRFGRIPFEQADNPVMSVVAFLAGVVGTGVAAEAAKTALHELTDGDGKKAKIEGEEGEGAITAEGDAGKSSKDDDKMDEDGTTDQEKEGDGMAVDSSAAASSSQGGGSGTKGVPHSKVARAAHLALKSSAKAAQALVDAEDAQIKNTLAQLIKLTLTKLEIKMTQFEELEEILEEERKSLEAARLALVNERLGLKKLLDNVRSEIAKNGGVPGGAAVGALSAPLGTTGQGTVASEVGGQGFDASNGPVQDASMVQLS